LTQWLILKVKTKHEMAVASQLSREGTPACVPEAIAFYRTKEDRANNTRSSKAVAVIPGLVFLNVEYAVPVGHIKEVSGYMRMSDYEYAVISDAEFKAFCANCDTIRKAAMEADALRYAMAAKKARKQVLKFKDGLERLKENMMTRLEKAV
jgi:hypothetical protein